MGLEVTKEICNDVYIYIFTIGVSLSDKEFAELLGILDKLLFDKKPFTFMIDSRNCKRIPIKASIALISWLKKRRPIIPGVLIGSTVVFSSAVIANLLINVFKIQKPVSPNKMTTDFAAGKLFLEDICKKKKTFDETNLSDHTDLNKNL